MDMFDDDLKEIMGDRYDDGEAPTEMPLLECKPKYGICFDPNAAHVTEVKFAPEKREAMDAQHVPYPKAERGFMDRLRSCATWGSVCGAISMLMWWFEVNGLMAMEAAYPCILACGIIGAFGVGLNFKK